MKVIMTCGGTGGHIYPAIAIANKIKEENPQSEIIFIGAGRPLEKKAILGAGYELRVISASGFHRRKLYRNIATAKDMIKGLVQAGGIIKEVNPTAVIGTGGYVCVPVLIRANQMGIKTYIHEQNAMPGLANRLLAAGADKIFLGFEEAAPFFKEQNKLFVTGNPIRKSFEEKSKNEARKQLSEKKDTFIVLIFGGSLGSAMINRATIDALPYFSSHENLSVYFVTGSRYYEEIKKEIEENNISENSNVKLMEYAENMDILLRAADLAVSRSGALTLAEEALVGVPAILIPSPNVTGNHQFHNAKAVSENGGAIILEEKDLSGTKLAKTIINLSQDSKTIAEMSSKIKDLANNQSASIIYRHLDLSGKDTNRKPKMD